jgi:hypothetical protein
LAPQLESLEAELHNAETYLKLAETLEGFLARLAEAADVDDHAADRGAVTTDVLGRRVNRDVARCSRTTAATFWSCQTTTSEAAISISESSPNPASATDRADDSGSKNEDRADDVPAERRVLQSQPAAAQSGCRGCLARADHSAQPTAANCA